MIKIISFLFSTKKQLIFLYRISHYLITKENKLLNQLVKVLTYMQHILFGCYIHPKCIIGKNVNFPHPVGIVIGENVRIGNNVTIFQNVTIGSHGKMGQKKAYPSIGDNVKIFAGAVVIGDISIGSNSIIGANSVVTKDVQPYTTVAGVPAKKIS